MFAMEIGDLSPLLQMGYAKTDQVGGGLLSRLYSRAFIVGDLEDSSRVVFVSIDIGMVSQRVRLEVKDGLGAFFLWDFLGVMLGLCWTPQQRRLGFAHSCLSGRIARGNSESQICYRGASNAAEEGGSEVVESCGSFFDDLGFTSGRILYQVFFYQIFLF